MFLLLLLSFTNIAASGAIPQKPFYVVRHGMTEWNRLTMQHGQADIPLNDAGKKQAAQLRIICDTLPITHFCSSTLSRAYETMQILNSARALPESRYDDLKEQGKGDLEGIAAQEWDLLPCEVINAAVEDKVLFKKRTQKVLCAILSQPGIPCIVAHSNNVRCMSKLLGCPVSKVPHDIIWYFEPQGDGCPWKMTELVLPKN